MRIVCTYITPQYMYINTHMCIPPYTYTDILICDFDMVCVCMCGGECALYVCREGCRMNVHLFVEVCVCMCGGECTSFYIPLYI